MDDGTHADDSDGESTATSGRLKRLATGALVLAGTLVFAGFWLVVARIHYLQQEWLGVVVTGAVGLLPVALAAASGVRRWELGGATSRLPGVTGNSTS